ncbi:hypothetical protein BKH42_03545 [Helicobacter sp. 13S00482-2]|uniref:hypothetical protein n=1 Tax=Helicobacter sp. 13S00482-2 TaxID=1476200 RepID=UPI000BA68342|nr:hypothetical protein [Helicobacter sp. 13S00482-2]PAF53815.1 hypothetical protein BKH42_03545 [Helicobacter sp. 13S00482-2]
MDFFINNTNIWHLSILDFVLIISFFKIRGYFLNSMTGVFIFYFLGTFLHELFHFLMALMLRAKPRISFLFPKKMSDGSIMLGRVETSYSWWKALPISMAPLLLLIVVYMVLRAYFLFFGFSFFSCAFYLYLAFVLIDSAIPSKQDFKIAFCSPMGVFLWIFIGTLIYNYYNYLDPRMFYLKIKEFL